MPKLNPNVVELANKLSRLGFWAEFDGEAALAAARERAAATEGKGYMVDKAALKEVFLGLGYDKVTTEEEEAGDEEDAARPPPKEEVTDYAERAFDLLDTAAAGQLDLRALLTTINTCKLGYGEPAFRFALKACVDDESATNISEEHLWQALTRSASQPLDSVLRNHLRRAWRGAVQAGKGEEEEEEEEQEGGEEGAGAAPDAPPPLVEVEDFVTKITEDDVLASVLLKEVPIPIAEPAEGDEPPVDDS